MRVVFDLEGEVFGKLKGAVQVRQGRYLANGRGWYVLISVNVHTLILELTAILVPRFRR